MHIHNYQIDISVQTGHVIVSLHQCTLQEDTIVNCKTILTVSDSFSVNICPCKLKNRFRGIKSLKDLTDDEWEKLSFVARRAWGAVFCSVGRYSTASAYEVCCLLWQLLINTWHVSPFLPPLCYLFLCFTSVFYTINGRVLLMGENINPAPGKVFITSSFLLTLHKVSRFTFTFTQGNNERC